MKNRKTTSSLSLSNPAPLRSNDQPVIGFLCPMVHYSITQELWAGINDAAVERGANLVCLAGTGGEDPNHKYRNLRADLFDLIDQMNLINF